MSNNCASLDLNGTGDLGRLIDQVLDRIDHHETEAAGVCHLAQWHRRQIRQHKAIKRELEKLIPIFMETRP